MNPLLIFKTIGVSVGIGGGITGSVFSSFQAFTKITIEEFFGSEWFDYGASNEDWQLLKKKLNESTNIDDKKLESTALKEAKSASDDQNGEKVKKWCSNKKDFKIKKLLPSSFESLLLSYIKEFCIITIGEKITSSKQFTLSDSENETLKTKTNELAAHESSNNSQRGKIDGIKELEDAKAKENEDDKKKALLNWCQKTYKKTYKNANDNLWKVADYYCKKT